MKNIYTFIIFILVAVVLLVPLSALPKNHVKDVLPVAAAPTDNANESGKPNQNTPTSTAPETVRLYNDNTKKISVVDMKEYLFCVVASECPMSYADEALKAQIVAAHTFTLYRIKENLNQKYDVTTNPETSQAYQTLDQIKSNWGQNYNTYAERLKELINQMYKYVVVYDGEPILAVYHAISPGKTEYCKNVWVKDLPYLRPVDSQKDKLSANYLSEVKVTKSAAETKLKGINFSLTGLLKGSRAKSESGNVLKIEHQNQTVTGGSVQKLFSLRSCNFDVAEKSGMVVFSVRGYGHGVGMSQTGANYMANEGKTYQDILKHYYKGVVIGEVE